MASVTKFDIFIKHHQYGLRILDAWPAANSLPGFYFSISIILFFLVFQIWNIAEVYKDLEDLMDNLISTIGMICVTFKIMTFRLKRRKLKSVVRKMFEDWKPDVKRLMNPMMVENWSHSQLISKIMALFDNTVNFMYFLRTIVSYTLDAVEERKFLVQVTFPFDARQSPVYELIIFGQFVTVSLCCNSQALIEGLFVTSVLHTCAKADVVREEIMRFSEVCQLNRNDKRSTLATFRKLMRKHMKFIEFSDNIQDIFSLVAFFHTYMMSLLQVFAGYMLIDGIERDTELINFVHYAIISFGTAMISGYYCVIGEHLTNQIMKTSFSYLSLVYAVR